MIRQKDVTPECWAALQAIAHPPAPAPPDEGVSEKQWGAEFRDTFKRLGWQGYHTLDSRGSKHGFPDWVLWRERIVFVELKSETGRLTAAQEAFRDAIRAAGGEWHLWRPSDWREIETVLGAK